MKISVAVRQKFHGFQLAQQLQNHNSLSKLYTAHYGSILGKDNSVGFSIDRKKVATNTYSALLTYGIKNNGFNNDDRFGKWVAGKLKDENIIVTWGIQALPIIKRAKELGIKVVLERGSSHASFQRDILMEEYRSLNISTVDLEKSFSPKRIERELLEYELADVVSIPSSFVKHSFTKNNFEEEKLFINAYGADLINFTYIPKPHKLFRLIYSGTLSIRKGIHYLLEAFSNLKLPEAELWLVGKVEEEIKPFILKYSAINIKIQTPVPQQHLAKLYNQCDVFVICSIEEGMAMVQTQAMSCGLPLICTTNTGGDDLIVDGVNGFVIPIRQVQILEEKIEFLYMNRDKCKEMGKNALKTIQSDFSWKNYGNRAITFYKQLIREFD
jgi:glycosyltransferase involved in cell wall biosynthesis